MKASEMTNEELANYFETLPFNYGATFNEAMREAAARLRKIDDYAEMCADTMREVAALKAKLLVAEDALEKSPCGEVYQLGLVDDDGNCYIGIAIKFDGAEGLKLPPVGHGDRFVVVPYSALSAIREEGALSE